MLQNIRDNAQGTIAKVIIALLVVSLSIWGLDSIVGGSGEPEVAKVNGESITEREFLRVTQLERQRRLMDMDTPDPTLLDDDAIRQDVLQALIRERVLIQDASAQGLSLSDADIDGLITSMPQFRVNGTFNRDAFVATVRNMGMGIGEFREALKQQFLVNQIRAGVIESAAVNPGTVEDLIRIQNQSRSFRLLTLPASEVEDGIVVTDSDIESFYSDNPDAFKVPETVDVAYIVLSLDEIARGMEVSTEAMLELYQRKAQESPAAEERRAAHILVESGANADERVSDIAARLDAGEDFAELAREFSADPGSAVAGGDLGFAGRGIYDPAFETALFDMSEGEIRGPVESDFGLHFIKLTAIRAGDVPSFAEMEAELRQELARDAAGRRFAELRTELADLAYAAPDLAEPAERLGLEVRQQAGVTRDGGQRPFDHAGLLRQLYSQDVLRDRYNTELIDISNSEAVVARVMEHHPATQRELAEVRDEIQSVLYAAKVRDALTKRANVIIASLKDGKTLEELDVPAERWQTVENATRSTSDVPFMALRRAFELPRPAEGGASFGVVESARQAMVIVLDAVNEGEVAQDAEELRALSQFLAMQSGQREYLAYEQQLRDTADVRRR